jgi:hypothetical protein
LLVNWLIIIVMFISSIMVVLYRIKRQGRWSWRGIKWDDSSLFMFLIPPVFLVFLYFSLYVILLVLKIRDGINV